MNQAVSEELFSDLSTSGFESLFEPEPGSTGSNGTLGAASLTTWTLRAASENLGLSPNTIRKRIRTGELQAQKVVGANGPEWRIHPPATYAPGAGSTDIAGGADAASDINNFPTIDALLKILETQAKQLEVATLQLAASTEQVKAATRVIAYQQLQLEEKNNKVKLLIDSRHHDNWFVKIVSRLKKA